MRSVVKKFLSLQRLVTLVSALGQAKRNIKIHTNENASSPQWITKTKLKPLINSNLALLVVFYFRHRTDIADF